MAKLLSTIIDGFLSSKTFVSGALGSGWRIWKRLGRWIFEVDDLVVRNTMTVFELLIQKIRAVKGALAITQASGKIKEIREDDTNYYIQVEDEMSFVAHDIVRCQTFSSGQKNYWVIVSDVVNDEIVILKTEFEGSSLPAIGDEIVQFGNTTDTSRQSAIYLHADEGGLPAIDVLFGINSKSFEGKTKIRIGGDIPGELGKKGFFCENGLIKSVNTSGEAMYMLRPDGSGMMAKGNISWDADGNGSIFNKAIYWGKDGFHFGNGIKLTWDNLDETAKENLKGEPGKDGTNGTDGVAGSDGTSIVWKGDFSSHPSNPKNGWAYRNTTTGKSYVYQDSAWYVMTIDGVDGVNGNNGKDGLDIVWKGDLSTPPSNPQKNWVYRDTDNGRVYIYNGMAWALMVADGNDGTDGTNGRDGMDVYITYHDSETEPSKPTGNGTTGGWHTNSTANVIWISQKVAGSASSGTWGNSINIKGKPGADANLLPWVEEWNNNKTEIGGEYVISPKMFSGTRDKTTGKLTGVSFGRGMVTVVEDGVEKQKTGVFGLKDGKITFSIDAETGNVELEGIIKAIAGLIGNFNIGDDFIGKSTSTENPNSGMSLYEEFIKFKQGNRLALIGSNVFAPSTGLKGVGRFHNKEYNPRLTNYGIEIDVSGANENVAIDIPNGDLLMGSGLIKGGRYNLKYFSQLNGGYIGDYDDYIVCTNSDLKNLFLPASPGRGKTILVKQLGSGNVGIIPQNGQKMYDTGNHYIWGRIKSKSGGVTVLAIVTFIGMIDGVNSWVMNTLDQGGMDFGNN